MSNPKIKVIPAYFSCLFFIFTLLFSNLILAINLQPIVTFDESNELNFNWKKVVSYPNETNKYLVFNKTGEIKIISKGKAKKKLFFDLALAIDNDDINLSAVAFHPNHTLKDQHGYQVIYTAHQEAINSNPRTIRIPRSAKTTNQYDLVITEWQIDTNYKLVDKNSKREIIRIASPDKNILIQQLTFNNHLRPWQENFGELFITLNHSEEFKNIPLYSGVVLAIKPEKFGLRNYTVPAANPFMQHDEINNEIVLLGAKNIEKIIWQKKKIGQWFIINNENDKRTLSIANMGDNFTKKAAEPLWQDKNSISLTNIVWYEGRRLNELLYSFIILNKTSVNWQLQSLSIDLNNKITLTNLEKLSHANIKDELGLAINSDDEIILLDKTNGVFSLLTATNNTSASNTNKSHFDNEKSLSFNPAWILLIIPISAMLAIYLYLKPRELAKDKSFLNKYYARFELTNNDSHIALFKRHKLDPDLILPIDKFINSAIYLNNEKVNKINTNNIFDDEALKDLTAAFSIEQRHKMIDNRVRNISIKLTDVNNKKYTICLYYRRGNQRYTRIHYFDSLKLITDWCKTYNQIINK